jgi:hypothetical protein
VIVNPALVDQPPMAASWPTAVSAPINVGMQMPTPVDLAAGITAQALLAAVAMRRGQPMGPASDHEIEDFVCDALDMLAGANDVEVRCEGGRATLTGVVAHKRLKRDVGEVAWMIPTVNDVQNNVTIAARRRPRGSARDTEASAGSGANRK